MFSMIQLLAEPLLISLSVGTAICGVIAVVSPKTFVSISNASSRSVNTDVLLAWLEHRMDLDQFVLRQARFFGLVIVAVMLYVGSQYLYA